MRRWSWFNRSKRSTPLFELGRIVITNAARDVLRRAQVPAGELLRRHAFGDWGEVDEIDRKQNDLGLRLGLRLRSVYSVQPTTPMASHGTAVDLQTPHENITVWLISQPNRSRTTILSPREIFDETSIDDANE